VQPTEPAAPRRVRRRGVGPFSLRQVTITIVAILGTAIIGTLATVKIGSTNQVLPVPDPSAFLIGSPIPGLNLGDLAPELSVTSADGTTTQLMDLQGNPIRLADLRGKAIWLNFWASWCPPCQYETPTLRAMDERYRSQGLAVIGIQVQQIQDDAQQYADRYELKYTIGSDVTGAVFHAYRVFALPTQFFIDPNGVIRKIVNGPLDQASAEALIGAILPPSAPGASPPPGTASTPAPSPSPRSSP
jgi:cytochrome c biogenesis protein CcmG/thiol:disulfide interchange protein DsbE